SLTIQRGEGFIENPQAGRRQLQACQADPALLSCRHLETGDVLVATQALDRECSMNGIVIAETATGAEPAQVLQGRQGLVDGRAVPEVENGSGEVFLDLATRTSLPEDFSLVVFVETTENAQQRGL